uniref:Multiple epidermal growth factor-like domains protein 10 n=1 Tax=Crassostrea virginica TaxID=6565 RepID=A0A8B8BQE7_CRAVI|nr:multiple epidermal growth factor-like domains protein 10 [Crassostrea virginica]
MQLDIALVCFTGLLISGHIFSSAYDDLSYKKDAAQSNTAVGSAYGASNAVDRNIATCMRTDPIGINSPDEIVWWQVDLGGVYSIYSVNILFKSYAGSEMRQRGRFAGFSLHTSNNRYMDKSSHCYKNRHELPPLNFSTTCIASGRYVTFYNERLDGSTYPAGYIVANVITELCEFIVKGCNRSGVYGSNCEIHCPINCKFNSCHIEKGTCFECNPGWTGATCDEKCDDGLYGQNCNKNCSGISGHCMNITSCNHVTGQCDNGCSHGWHGPYCEHRCKGHCKHNVTCNHVTGLCEEGCAAGWNGSDCNQGCVDGRFGYNCEEKCGHCLNLFSCNKENGFCEEGCDLGYTNEMCNEKCPKGFFGNACVQKCSGHCFNNSECEHIHGMCISGCENGYIGVKCNESCMEGYFGKNCSHVCSANCKTCAHTDGQCSCFAGWTGFNCSEECTDSYGENCRHSCSQHCINDTCNRFNGSCLSGCKKGYFGDHCDQSCVLSYGEDCRYRCSTQCFTGDCDRFNGTCEYGCKAGFHGEHCDQKCMQSYGANCKYACSEHCYDLSCDTVSGRCLTGCMDDFFGEKCDQAILITSQSRSTFWSTVGPFLIGINGILSIGLIMCLCGVCTKRISLSVRTSARKKVGVYKDIENQPTEAPHYEELTINGDGAQYTNTILH